MTEPTPHPAPQPAARYDTDPAALAWARARVRHQLDRLAAFEEHATQTGRTDQARGLRVARRSTEQLLLGGRGCVVGAFDERRPTMFGGPSSVEEQPGQAPAPSLRDRIAAALSNAGAFCGNCGFEPGDRGKCADCERCWSSYADAVLPLLADERDAGRRDGLREAATVADEAGDVYAQRGDTAQAGAAFAVMERLTAKANGCSWPPCDDDETCTKHARADTTHPGGQS